MAPTSSSATSTKTAAVPSPTSSASRSCSSTSPIRPRGTGWSRRSGPFDIAFLNAGVSTNSGNEPGQPQGFDLESFPIVAMPDAAYRRIMSVNVDGVVFGTRAAAPGDDRRPPRRHRRHRLDGRARPDRVRPGVRPHQARRRRLRALDGGRARHAPRSRRPHQRDLPRLHRHQHPDAGPEAADRRARTRDHDARARRRCGAAGAARAGQRRAMGGLAGVDVAPYEWNPALPVPEAAT